MLPHFRSKGIFIHVIFLGMTVSQVMATPIPSTEITPDQAPSPMPGHTDSPQNNAALLRRADFPTVLTNLGNAKAGVDADKGNLDTATADITTQIAALTTANDAIAAASTSLTAANDALTAFNTAIADFNTAFTAVGSLTTIIDALTTDNTAVGKGCK